MASTLVHYADIYDLDDKHHREPRWDIRDNVYRYYEGYGQRDCSEKKDFLESINRDHELWSGETPERKRAPRIFTAEEHIDRMLSQSDVGLQVDFLTETWDGLDRGLPQGSEPTFKLDGRDREDRLSWNFSKMLADYCEKAHDIGGKKKFFKLGGAGERWSKDKAMMKEFGGKFEYLADALKDEDFKISLSDQSVKNYPRYHFEVLHKRYTEFMGSSSLLRADAPEFVPGGTQKNVLCRTSPKKICGVYSVEQKPPEPCGPPPPRRPSASSKESSSMLLWHMKEESDIKIDNLEKKLDLLINMSGPVVQADSVV